MKKPYGVQEWADHSNNIQLGCTRNCHYCYAKSIAIRFKRATSESWTSPEIDLAKAVKCHHKVSGRIMFPTSHDIEQGNVAVSLITLRAMIDAGNEVLIVSKPDPKCIRLICDEFEDDKNNIVFRFTIGSADDTTLRFWEPNAPSFKERISALRYAFEHGYKTSISCEPMLDKEIDKVVDAVLPFVNDTVWLGRVNKLRQSIALNCPGNVEVMEAADRLLAEQTDEWLWELYHRYKSNPQIKFKDSIKKVVGLDLPQKAGLDI